MSKKTDLISNNTGYSIKNYFIYSIINIVIYLLLIVGFVLVWDVVIDGKIDTDLNQLAGFVGATAAVLTAAGIPKAIAEIMERKKSNEKDNTNN